MISTCVVAVAKFLVHVPGWIIVSYLVVAGVMAITLLLQFLRNARTRNAPGNAWLVLLILFFPLAALSMVWPVTMPFVVGVFWREQKQKREQRGFEVA